MNLTVLGGAAASPNAGMGCSGYLVETADTRLVLDLGPGTLTELRRHTDFRTLDAVVISHMHIDHVLDLLALRHALAYNPVPPTRPTPVWLPPGGAALLAQAVAPFDRCDEPSTFAHTVANREYDPTRPLVIGDTVVRFAPTVHYLPCWAMRIESNGRTLGYTADTGPTADLGDLFAGVKILIAEATLLDPGDQPVAERGSLTAAEAGAIAQSVGAETLVLSHLWEERGFAAAHEQAATTFTGRIELARPGLVVP